MQDNGSVELKIDDARESRWALWFSALAWTLYCIAIVGPALVVDSVPFAGENGIFAAGGRYALRVAALGVPLMAAASFWALETMTGRRFRFSSFLWGLLGLFLLAALSTVFALDRRVALFGFWIDEQGMLVWVFYFGIAFLGSQLISTRRRLAVLTSCIVGVGTLVAAIALAEVAGVRLFGILAEEWAYARGVSTMMNPDFLGTFLVLPAVLAVGLALGTAGVRRWAAVIASIAMLISLAYSLTRGAWIGVTVGLVFIVGMYAVFGRDRRRPDVENESSGLGTDCSVPVRHGATRLILGAVAALAVVGSLLALKSEAIVSRVLQSGGDAAGLDGILSGRLSIWREVLAAIRAHPWVGAGPDNVVYAWQPHAGEGTLFWVGAAAVVNSAHNVLLDLALQFGVVFAVALAVGVTLLGFRAVARLRHAAARQEAGSLEMGWIAAGAGMAVAFFTGVTTVPIMTVGAALVGVLLALDVHRTLVPNVVAKYAVLMATAVVALGMGSWATLTGMSAIDGNQYAPTAAIRAQRDLAALRRAPWRIYPASDLVMVTEAMGESEQGMISMTTERALNILVERDGRNALTLYTAGNHYFVDKRDPARALEFANRSLAARPVFVPGLMLKGDALAALGESEEALTSLRRAVALEASARPLLAWEAPWTSYLGVLISQASDPAAALEARDALAAYRSRFPNSPALQGLEQQLAGFDEESPQQ